MAATDQAVALGQGASLNLQITDPAGTEALIEASTELGTGLVGFATKALESSERVFEKALGAVERSGQGEQTTLAQDALKAAIPVLITAAVAWAIAR